jgi:hypothetical protein
VRDAKIAENRREAPDVVRVRMGIDDIIEITYLSVEKERGNDPSSYVETGPWKTPAVD